VEGGAGGLADAEPLGEGGSRQQPGAGHGVAVVEAAIEVVKGGWRGMAASKG
jgi:hypothetical protein